MIEAAMYVALGFCTAGLIGLAILPAFYRRASRLTEEALRAVNPSSYAEVRAAQDQARARHAVELRRVERLLETERAKAATHHLEASRLQTEIAGIRKAQEREAEGHRVHIAELEAKLADGQEDRKAADLLSAEIKSVRQKLVEAEKALSESWTRDLARGNEAADDEKTETGSDWLPARDTMTLATITGLEAEVATLRSRLARYEPTVAGQIEASLEGATKARLAELEGQLVDTESKYISAQAEATRLKLLLESANLSESDVQIRLTAHIEEISEENARIHSDLEGKTRQLDRLSGQLERLRRDIASAPALSELRKDFRTLAARISAADSVTISAGTISAGTISAGETPARASGSGADKEPARDGSGQLTAGSADASAAANGSGAGNATARNKQIQGTNGKSTDGQSAASKSPADIADAADALVSRIVASQRSSKRRKSKTEEAAAAASAPQADAPVGKKKSAKQKSKDVA